MATNNRQLSIEFETGLLEQFPDFRDVVRASVYSCGRPFKHIASDLDMSVSELSRKLSDNPNDPVHFPLHRLAELVDSTGDRRPVYWLVERFLEDADVKRKRSLDQLASLMPQIESLLKSVSK